MEMTGDRVKEGFDPKKNLRKRGKTVITPFMTLCSRSYCGIQV